MYYHFSSNVPRTCLFMSNAISGSTKSAVLRLFMPFLSSCFSIIRALFAYESATSLYLNNNILITSNIST